MSLPFIALTLFAEDAREELRGQTSLIGILPDNLTVPQVPGALAKLAIYTRIHIPIDVEPEPISVFLRFPDQPEQSEQLLGEFGAEMIRQTREEAMSSMSSYYGLVSQATASPFPVVQAGRILIAVRSGTAEQISGYLRFISAEPGTDIGAKPPAAVH